MKKLISLLPVCLLILSCSKEKQAAKEGYSEIPAIEIVSINSKTIKEYQDSVVITISYKDLNGDIGEQNPDDNSLYVKDQRLPAADYYHIPPITPEGVEFKTRGTIRVVIPTLFLLGNGGNEKTTLTLKIQDQADHWSNELTTEPITITK